MKTILYIIVLTLTFAVAANVYAQHSLQIDDGHGHYSQIKSQDSDQLDIYILPPGGGTFLTEPDSGKPALVWLTKGNDALTDLLNNFLGTTSATPLRIVTGGANDAHTRIYIDTNGLVGIATTTSPSRFSVGSGNPFQVTDSGDIVDIKGVPYQWPNSQADQANEVLTNDGSGILSWAHGVDWLLTGNGGTTPGTNFLGTTDNTAFEIQVFSNANGGSPSGQGNQRVMAYFPNSFSPNILGGYQGNQIDLNYYGNVIAGGGDTATDSGPNTIIHGGTNVNFDFIGGGAGNNITDASFASITGGQGNEVQGGNSGQTSDYSNVGGGNDNDIYYSTFSLIGGGVNNSINGFQGGSMTVNTIGGGSLNAMNTSEFSVMQSTIGGGSSNVIFANNAPVANSTISGGAGNSITDAGNATIAGGNGNEIQGGEITATADSSFIGGGVGNDVYYSTGSVITGGNSNAINGITSGGSSNNTIGGGFSNGINSNGGGDLFANTIPGGASNSINGTVADPSGNTIGGGISNSTHGASFATIGGGVSNTVGSNFSVVGNYAFIGGGTSNSTSSDNSVISGGTSNSIGNGATNATISGGNGNNISNSSSYATIAGGSGNNATNSYAAVGGGNGNTAGGAGSVVAGGGWNQNTSSSNPNSAGGDASAIVGGILNNASGAGSFIGGGGYDGSTASGNTASGNASVVGGGISNTASTPYATVGGGQNNKASGYSNETVGGGVNNQATAFAATVAGGNTNTATDNEAFVGGGTSVNATGFRAVATGGAGNNSTNNESFVGGGETNTASGDHSTLGGGFNNTASNYVATIGGGSSNQATGVGSTVAGGGVTASSVVSGNTASGASAFIGAGYDNTISGDYGVVVGGEGNISTGTSSFVGGGFNNHANGQYTTIPGGKNMTMNANFDFGFNNDNTATHSMTIATSSIAVFGNTDMWLANTDNTAHALNFYQPQSSSGAFPAAGTFYSGFKASAVAQSDNYLYTLPSTTPAANKALRVSSTAGSAPLAVTLDWVTVPSGSGTLNTIPKWTPDGNTLGDSKLTDDGSNLKYNNVFTVSTAGVVSGATGISSSGTINFSGLTASRNVRTDASSNLTTGAINLAGGATEVSGILPIANGGTNSSTALNNGRVMISNTGSVVEDAAGTANQLLHGDLSWGAISLTNQVSGVLPIANGGTNSGAALSGSSIMVSNGTQIIQGAAGTTTTVLHGNAGGTPTYGSVSLTADVSNVLPIANGGTNTSTAPSSNALVLGNAGGTAYTSLGSTGTTTTLLHGNAAGAPSFGAASLTTDVSGTLPIANGGTNSSTALNNGRVMISNTGSVVEDAAGTANQLLHGDLSWGAISLTNQVSGVLPIANGGTNSGAALSGSSIMVSNGTQIIQGAAGTTTTVLHGNAGGTPTYGSVSLTADVSNVLPIANGGTNTSTAPSSNALVLGNAGGTAYTSLGSTGTTTTLLHGNAAGAPSFGAASLTTDVSGTLPIANGGTNSSTALNNGRVMISNTGSVVEDAAGTANQLLHGDLSWGAISLTNQVSGVLPIANGGTNSGAALSGSSIMVSNGTQIIQGAAGTTTTVLHGNAGGTPTYGSVSLTADVSNVLPIANGGTNTSTAPSSNALVLGNAGGTAYTSLGSTGTTTTLLHGNAAGAPSFGAASLTTDVSGTLPIANGGTNSSTALNNGRVMISNTGSVVEDAAGTANQLLHGDLSWGAISLTNQVSGVLPIANGGTNSGAALSGSSIMVSNGTQIIQGAAGTASQVLHGDLTYGGVSLTSDVSNVLPIANGGTNSGAALSGSSIMVSNGTQVIQGNTGTASQVLHGDLTYGGVSLTSDVSNVLPIANGGTNSGAALSGSSIMVSNGTQVIQGNTGTASQVLHGDLTYGGVSLTSDVSNVLPIANGGTNSGAALSGSSIMVSNGTQVIQGNTGTASQVLYGDLTWGDLPVSGWALGGNTGLTDNNQFGTTDATDVIMEAGGNTQMTLLHAGGINLPSSLSSGVGVIFQNNIVLIHTTADASNFFAGLNAGNLSLTGISNTGIGHNALNANTTGFQNLAVGDQAMANGSTNSNSTAIGHRSMENADGASENTAVGWLSMGNVTSGDNVAVGGEAMAGSTNATRNTAVGVRAMITNTTGGGNTALGWEALKFNSTSSANVAVGYTSLMNTTASNNVAIGYQSGVTNTTGTGNTFLGEGADAGSNNLTDATAIGSDASVASSNTIQLGDVAVTLINTTGNYTTTTGVTLSGSAAPLIVNADPGTTNYVLTSQGAGATPIWASIPSISSSAWALGGNAGLTDNNQFGTTDAVDVIMEAGGNTQMTLVNTGGINIPSSASSGVGVIYQNGNPYIHSSGDVSNIFVGQNAGNLSTVTGTGNSGFGNNALKSISTGIHNTAIGANALASNTTGGINVAIGSGALSSNTTASLNVAVGGGLASHNGSNGSNIAVGFDALSSDQNGATNTAVGDQALVDNIDGFNNTSIGGGASGAAIVHGGDNTFLGTSANADGDYSNATAIGANSTVTASNSIQLGDNSVTAVNTSGNITTSGGVTVTAGITRLSYATVSAGAAITIPTTSSVIEITDDAVAGGANLITMPAVAAADNGRIIYIHNADADATTGTVINSGATATFVVSGAAWQRVGP